MSWRAVVECGYRPEATDVPAKPTLAVLISGRGSNLAALIDATRTGALDANIGLVISNKPEAAGIQVAEAAGIATCVIDHRDFDSREAFDHALVQRLQSLNPALVCLAGFMRILTPVFTDAFAGRAMNVHPSLLPAYPGLNTHQRAIDAGDPAGGSSIHYVTGELDGGPVVLQGRVPIIEGDSADTLAARVLEVEHRIFPMAAQWHLTGRLKLTGNQAELDGALLPSHGVRWPLEAEA